MVHSIININQKWPHGSDTTHKRKRQESTSCIFINMGWWTLGVRTFDVL